MKTMETMETISMYDAIQEIENSNGKIFSVKFLKRNGEMSKMVCRTGVKKGVKGIGAPYNFREKGLISVYSMDRGGFRCFGMEGLQELRINRKIFEVK